MSSYPPPPGGPPPWGGYSQSPAPDNSQAVWSLTLAVIGIVLTCCCGLLGVGLGIAAVVLAQGAKNQAAAFGPHVDTSLATVAFWLGIVAIALGALSFLGSIAFNVVDVFTRF